MALRVQKTCEGSELSWERECVFYDFGNEQKSCEWRTCAEGSYRLTLEKAYADHYELMYVGSLLS